MNNNSSYDHRRSIRLQSYDYSQEGMYFITICTYRKQCIFGKIIRDKMILNQVGKLVKWEWLKSVEIRQEIDLDEWVIMPNHLHGIVIIDHNNINDKSANIIGANLAPVSIFVTFFSMYKHFQRFDFDISYYSLEKHKYMDNFSRQ